MNRFSIDEDGCHEILKIYYLDNTYSTICTLRDYYGDKLTKNEGLDCILQQNYYKTWKLNLETKFSWKQK